MSFIFRAYHAMARQRGMSTRKGLPTAAIYVFVNMLRKLRDDFSPHYLAAVFDVAAPTFRDQQFKDYKANRSEMPGDLAQQIPYIRRALEAYRIPILEMPGYEADDVIGTLAKKAADAGHPVYVVSSDKDMLQLVNDRVQVLNPPKDNLICDAAKVEEILGVPPNRVIDVMALRGDSIDNIPGAPGMLSMESPRKAITSMTRFGGTPKISSTFAASQIKLSFGGFSTCTRSFTNCSMSLSLDTTYTGWPAFAAFLASVPITSSAS